MKNKQKTNKQTKKQTKTNQNGFERSPTLETVYMVEKTIDKYSGEYNKTQVWKKLPKKVMWQTYNKIINYLEEINKIAIARESILVYIWNPELVKKHEEMKNYA